LPNRSAKDADLKDSLIYRLPPEDRDDLGRLMEIVFQTHGARELSEKAVNEYLTSRRCKAGVILGLNLVKGRVTPIARKMLDEPLVAPPQQPEIVKIDAFLPLVKNRVTLVDEDVKREIVKVIPLKSCESDLWLAGVTYSAQKAPIALIFAVYEKTGLDLNRERLFFKTTIEFIEKLQIRLGFNENYEIEKARYRQFIQNGKHIFFATDKRGYLLEVNRAFENLTGRMADELIGQKIDNFISASDKSFVEAAGAENTEFVAVLVAPGQPRKSLVAQTWPIKGKNGRLIEIDAVAFEPKRRDPAEDSASRAALTGAECWPYPAVIADENGIIVDINSPGAELFRAQKEDLKNVYLIDRVDQKLRDAFLRAFSKLLIFGEEVEFNSALRSAKGEVVPVGVKARIDDGKPRTIQFFLTDITEKTRAEEEIKKLSQFPRETPNPVFCVDSEGFVTYQNQAMRDFLRKIGAGRIGRADELFESDAEFASALSNSAGSQIIVKNKEVRILERIMLASYSSFFGARETFVYLQDITELKTMADSLSRANVELTRLKESYETQAVNAVFASRQKSMFLANMSHELRTPLNSIIGFGELLYDQIFGPLNEKQTEYVGDILESSKILLELIEEVLDLAKIEAGKMELDYETFDVYSMLERCVHMVKEKAARHSIEISLNAADDVTELDADPRRFRQIVFNLLSNAVKFTPDGGRIGINARREDGFLLMEVWDTGIGISQEDQRKIFQAFEQADSSLTKKVEGAGLGLAIVNNFVAMHKGTVELESKLGRGSKFTVRLPLARPEGARRKREAT